MQLCWKKVGFSIFKQIHLATNYDNLKFISIPISNCLNLTLTHQLVHIVPYGNFPTKKYGGNCPLQWPKQNGSSSSHLRLPTPWCLAWYHQPPGNGKLSGWVETQQGLLLEMIMVAPLCCLETSDTNIHNIQNGSKCIHQIQHRSSKLASNGQSQ